MEINIRKAVKGDLTSLVRLDFEFSRPQLEALNISREPYFVQNYLDVLSRHFSDVLSGYDDEYKFVVAEVEGEVVGFISYYSSNEKQVNIARIFVGGNYKRKGIGTKILENLLDELKKSDVSRISVIPDGRAKKFYERLGFIDTKSTAGMVLEI